MYSAPRRFSHWFPWTLLASAAACTEPTSSTDLHPEGPPMIEQVRVTELYEIGGTSGHKRTVFAFGTHPDATTADQHPVTTASPTGNKLRIIIDELLRGNNLEEILCRVDVDDDSYARVPIGATPDDIARCAVPRDVLPARCPGSNPLSVCLCAKDGGCLVTSSTSSFTIAKGDPVGVQDLDLDGAADNTRFIKGAVSLQCGTIDVLINLDMSYWTPSGNQQKPAQGGFDALGPAVVVVPQGALPTSTECRLSFSSEVVDKDGIAVCAPPDGDIAAGCTPGDTSAIHFAVVEMTLSAVVDPTRQPRKTDIVIQANVPLDRDSAANVTVTEGPDPGTPYTQFTATVGTDDETSKQIKIHWTAVDGLAATTRYTITVPTTVTDAHHQSAKQTFQAVFVTGP